MAMKTAADYDIQVTPLDRNGGPDFLRIELDGNAWFIGVPTVKEQRAGAALTIYGIQLKKDGGRALDIHSEMSKKGYTLLSTSSDVKA